MWMTTFSMDRNSASLVAMLRNKDEISIHAQTSEKNGSKTRESGRKVDQSAGGASVQGTESLETTAKKLPDLR
jgi:DUF917 family protein